MSIIYHEQAKHFHLYNQSMSYIIQIMPMANWEICTMGNGLQTGSPMHISLRQESAPMPP